MTFSNITDVEIVAKKMLKEHDNFMSGWPYDKEVCDRLITAASFGAQAFAVCPIPDARPSAMLRALLLALVDPTHRELDYLRKSNMVRVAE
jgi:hypothetical protein